jgi:nucleotide-binding universal stress UspA family protein
VPAPVLAAVDPLTLDLAPAWFGAAVAGHTGAPLLVTSVYASDEVVDRLTGGQLGEELPRDAEGPLQRVLDAVRADGVVAEELLLGATSAPRGLELAAAEGGAGLLVVGSKADGQKGRVRPGSTGQRLLNGAECPVEIVPQGWERSFGLGTVGVAFVDTAEGRRALHGAHVLADRAGARLRVLAAVQPRGWMDGADGDVAQDVRLRAESAAQAAVSGLLGEPVNVDVEVREPADYLLEESAELDLLVCGSRGYGPTPATLLGGVARRLTADAACPVIVTTHGSVAGLEALIDQEPFDA